MNPPSRADYTNGRPEEVHRRRYDDRLRGGPWTLFGPSGVVVKTSKEVPVRTVFCLCILAAAVTATAAAADGGPSPGVATGWDGVLAPGGKIRYVAVPGGGARTVVEAVRVRGGRVESFAVIRGIYGVPMVTYGGQAGGLSHDGKTLVLSTQPGAPVSRFAFVSTKTFRVRQVVTLRGTFSFDALSPDAGKLYLIEYVDPQNVNHYRVRAYDLQRQRLLAGAIVDRREPGEKMRGQPVRRVTGAGGRWVYTLYTRQGAGPFVHALDSEKGEAVCLDLPWHGSQNALWRMRMRLSADGSKLVLRGKGRTIVVRTP